MNFELKKDLPKDVQNEITRIEAISSGLRTASEAAFLTALTPYLTNEVIEYDEDLLITKAAGNTLPTGYAGFKKGAIFIDKDASGNGAYINTGDETSASWGILQNGAESSEVVVPSGTPVNAVAATQILTVGGVPSDNDTVTIGSTVYTFESAIAAAAAATGVLTMTGNAQNAETVVIGNKTYTFKTALTEAKATGTYTLGANVADGDTVSIGGVVYYFTTNLSTPARANEVKIGASASDTLDNLIAAINGAAGAGTTYSTGTVAHTLVDAAAGAGDTMTVTAKTKGVAGNAITTTEEGGNSSWGAATLGSGADAVANEVVVGGSASASLDNLIAAITHGAGEGTTYSTGTTAHTQVTAAAGAGDTMDVTASATGEAGNAIATTETLANGSFGGATLSSGEDADSANMVLIGISAEACIDNLVAAINGDAGEGTTYGTGTVAHANVTAEKTAADKMTITAKVKGTAANSIATTEVGSNTSWGAATMAGGVNGTVGAARALMVDATYLYVAVAANTIADANWRRVTLGSAY